MGTLTSRLLILLMLALMVITGAYDAVRLARHRDQLIAQAREEERVFAETLALAVSRNVRWGRTSQELADFLDDVLARPGLLGVAIYDPRGQVVAERTVPDAPPAVADATVQQVLAARAAASLRLDPEGRPLLRHVQPFRWPGGRTGAVEVRRTLDAVERAYRREIGERVLARVVVLLAFVGSILAVTRWSVARPIRLLIRGAQAVGRGDLAQRIQLRRRDEIGQLAEEFNRMAANLQAAHDEILRQAEERRRLEQEVEQAQKMAAVGVLAAEVAHELGTPLNVIAGRAEVLAQTLPADHPERRHLEVILKQTDRIRGIVQSLLEYSRPRRPVCRPEALPPILARVAELLLGRLRARQVRLHLELSPLLPAVLGDADQLQQLFLNLVLNALDASPPGGVIRVTAGDDPLLPAEATITRGKVEGAHLAVHVVDQGPGISPDKLPHVFQPFFSTKGAGQGTGLGLPIVEDIVRAHRGEVELRSVTGRGTEVIVRLPLPGDEAATGAGPAAVEGAR